MKPRLLYIPLVVLIGILLFNEVLIYYFVIWNCGWPAPAGDTNNALRAFMIADTHLLGKFKGHWLDKLRREWQMWRGYRTAEHLLNPDAVFFLGDLMDEGKRTDRELFDRYSDRFHELFGPKGDRPRVFALAGNHDLGFHYDINPNRIDWFFDRYRTRTVDTVVLNGQPFVMVTSMALEGDGCRLCGEAERDLEELAKIFRCAANASCSNSKVDQFRPYRSPILLQHFPLFREDDTVCERDQFFDFEDPTRNEVFRPLWDCLSEESTKKVLEWIRPRAVFDGHSHRGCTRNFTSPLSFREYTVNSFSWRNGPKPSLLLVSIDNDDVTVSTCQLPNENTVIDVYLGVGVLSCIYYLVFFVQYCRYRRYQRLLEEERRAKQC